MTIKRKCAGEAGSVLIYILIGVALFAALGFALSRSGNGGMAVGQAGQSRLAASEILQYARSLQSAVQAMKINGIADGQISFENNVTGGYANSNCTEAACRVFLNGGGGLNEAQLDAKLLDAKQAGQPDFGAWVFSGANGVGGVGTDGSASDNAELLAVLPWVQKSLCLEINAELHVDNPGGNPPALATAADLSTKFMGSFSGANTITAASLSRYPHRLLRRQRRAASRHLPFLSGIAGALIHRTSSISATSGWRTISA